MKGKPVALLSLFLTLLAATPSEITQIVRYLTEVASAGEDLIEKGRVLDNFYIPTRYPNGHPAGAPFEHYGPLQSEEAIRYASEIVGFVRSQMA